MNKLGSAGAPGTGGFLSADPLDEHEAITAAERAGERKALTALAEHQARRGSSNGHDSADGESPNGHH